MMKNRILLILPLFLLLIACNDKGEGNESTDINASLSKEAPREAELADEKKKPVLKPVEVGNGPEMTVYAGSLEGNIPVTLYLYYDDRIIAGTLTYDKVGKAIDVFGQRHDYDDGKLYFNEYGSNGLISGMWAITIQKDKVAGSWNDPRNEKERKVELSKKGTKRMAEKLEMADPYGEYRYAFSQEDGGTGRLEIRKLTDDVAEFDIDAVTMAPAFRVATLEEAQELLEGNRIHYSLKEDDYIDCEFEVLLYRNFAAIEYLNERYECGFGMGAGVSGIYKKVK